MELLLVRHAIAEPRDDERWPDDRDRPLNELGEERMRRAAKGLARIVPEVTIVFSSPLVRAWRTAEILHEMIGSASFGDTTVPQLVSAAVQEQTH